MVEYFIAHETSPQEWMDSLNLSVGRTNQIQLEDNKLVGMVLSHVEVSGVAVQFGKTYLSMTVGDKHREWIGQVDEKVLELAKEEEKLKIIDALYMTQRTWDQIFRPSVHGNNTFRVMVPDKQVMCFMEETSALFDANMDLPSNISVVVSPNLLWCMNGQAGISWALKQLKFDQVQSDPTVSAPFVLPYDDEDDIFEEEEEKELK
jgi:hypothetical protein